MIIFVSDFNVLQGSGYTNISTNLCYEMFRKYKIGMTCLGFNYRGEEHNYPFSIVPLDSFSSIPNCIKEITNSGAKIDAVIVALDIPLQTQLKSSLVGYKYIGIFPLEAPPLSFNAAKSLSSFDYCLVMSEFAKEELLKQGVKSEFIPLGVSEKFKPVDKDKRKKLRKSMGYNDNDFVILTIAENQERKNLSKTAEIVSKFTCNITERDRAGYCLNKEVTQSNVYWNVVTTLSSPIGWDLDDLILRTGIENVTRFYEHGLPLEDLINLYYVSDCLLLTSKAEGLGIPILEAMACKLPCIGTDCTAINEHLKDGRGLLIQPDYILGDPFGNQLRYMVSIEDGVKQLNYLKNEMSDEDKEKMVESAFNYVNKRNWNDCSDVLFNSLKQIIK